MNKPGKIEHSEYSHTDCNEPNPRLHGKMERTWNLTYDPQFGEQVMDLCRKSYGSWAKFRELLTKSEIPYSITGGDSVYYPRRVQHKTFLGRLKSIRGYMLKRINIS